MQPIKLAVVGAGPVGLIGAYALLEKGFAVDLFDPFLFQSLDAKPNPNTQNGQKDLRYISLSYGTIALLESIGIDISHLAQKIETVHISTAGFWGACTMRASENDVPALAYSIHYQHLQKALLEKLLLLAQEKSGLLKCISAKVDAIKNQSETKILNNIDEADNFNELNELAYLTYHLQTTSQENLEKDLQTTAQKNVKTTHYHHIFICEGGVFDATQKQPKKQTQNEMAHAKSMPAPSPYQYHDQGQNAYIGFLNLPTEKNGSQTSNQTSKNIKNDPAARKIAWECFTDEGPLAILPYENYPNPLIKATHVIIWCKNRDASIFTNPVQQPRDLNEMTLSTTSKRLLSNLMQKSQYILQEKTPASRANEFLKVVSDIQWQQSFELGVRYRSVLQDQHLSYLGNAAQIMHPVAGQGLNLGVRQMLQAVRDFSQHTQSILHELEGQAPQSLTPSLLKNYKAYSLNQKKLNQDREHMIFLTSLMAKGFSLSPFSKIFSAGLQFVHSIPFLKRKLAAIFMHGG